MSLADIFKRKPKQLDADPEDGDGSEMMAGNEAVRKKQILLMSGGAAARRPSPSSPTSTAATAGR